MEDESTKANQEISIRIKELVEMIARAAGFLVRTTRDLDFLDIGEAYRDYAASLGDDV